MKTNFNVINVFSCGICNLNCRYCGIDKNPALLDVDKILEESFKGDYYFEKTKKYLPDPLQLIRMETWGGEPIMKIERIFPLIDNLIEYYPNFCEFFSSTNFSYPEWPDKIISLINEFGKYSYRKFNIHIQLSCDGPKYINDANRGEGVTDICLANYRKLLAWANENLPKNIYLTFFPKQTLDIPSVKLLQNYDSVYEYYKFFDDNFMKPANDLNHPRLACREGTPNTAVPSPVTKENGKELAKFCELCKKVQDDNKEKHLFKYYTKFIPFARHPSCPLANSFSSGSLGCGIGTQNISFLPYNLYCICHLGFMEFIEKYKLYEANSRKENKVINFDNFISETKFKQCVTEEEWLKFMERMERTCDKKSTNRMSAWYDTIKLCAAAGQIDEKYNDHEEALKAARQLTDKTSFCINDGLHITGSITLQPNGMIKQLLNGAMDIIEKEAG